MGKEELPYFRKRGFRGYWGWTNISDSNDNYILPNIALKAENILVNFLKELTIDKKICFSFKFIIEEPIFFHKQQDNTYNEGLNYYKTLSCHIYKEKIIDSEDILSIILSGQLYLMKFWANNLTYPKWLNLNSIIKNYQVYLLKNGFIIENDDYYFKPKNAIKFSFGSFNGLHTNQSKISYNLVYISNYITDNLVKFEFGSSITKFIFYQDLVKVNYIDKDFFEGSDKHTQFSKKYKIFSIRRQFDYDTLITMSPNGQWTHLKNTIIESLNSLLTNKKVPSTFNLNSFIHEVKVLLNEYEKLQINTSK